MYSPGERKERELMCNKEISDPRSKDEAREAFVELHVLYGEGEEREWKQTARWVKYEENVEEGANRWGKPHVSSVSYHSLKSLQQLIKDGNILLDFEERDIGSIASKVVQKITSRGLLLNNDAAAMVQNILLLPHKHVEDSGRNWRLNSKSNIGSTSNLQSILEGKLDVKLSSSLTDGATDQKSCNTTFTAARGRHEQGALPVARKGSIPAMSILNFSRGDLEPTSIDLRKLSLDHLTQEEVRGMFRDNDSILKRIPVGAEGTLVLAGEEETLDEPLFAFIRLASSCYLPYVTEVLVPVKFVLIVMGPPSYDYDFKEIGRTISSLMSNKDFLGLAYKAENKIDLLNGIRDYLEESVVLPPGKYEEEMIPFDDLKEQSEVLRLRKKKLSVISTTMTGITTIVDNSSEEYLEATPTPEGLQYKETEDDPLRRTNTWFGGLINDVKRRYPFYLSDFLDGLNMQCVAAVLFIAFGQISGSIAFGGLMGAKTKNVIGIIETLFTSAFGGIIFSLFSGQPLLIVATTPPLLLFDESLFVFCEANGIDFLAMRTWIGFWLFVVGSIFVCFELSSLVRFITRFTQEIFASLISLVFIVESLQNLVHVYFDHPLMRTYGDCETDPVNSSITRISPGPVTHNQPNTALLCSLLMFGTFYVAWSLKTFRASSYLTKTIRETLGNFCVPIAIACLVGIDFSIKETVTRKLDAPQGFQPTTNRTWLVDPSLVGIGVAAVSVLPSLLLFILLFMEVAIDELIVSKKDNKLRKGSGFHLDIWLICIINAIIALFGLPWACLPLVRGLAHVSALQIWSTNNAPGEKPKVLGIHEQRLTATVVSILTGASVAMASALELMPMAVLFGVFLFMGVASMAGIQFFERVALFFKQVENHPLVPYVRRVRTFKMHLFTLIQIFWLSILWGVKYTSVALSFPFILLILIPFRLLVLRRAFSPDELAALDSGGEAKKDL